MKSIFVMLIALLSTATSATPNFNDALKTADVAAVPRSTQQFARIGLFQLEHAPEQGALTLGIAPTGTTRLVADGRDVRVAPDGLFVIGFDRDNGATTLITAFLSDGRALSERLPVLAHHWGISVLPARNEHPTSDSDFQRRRPDEIAQINAARAMITTAQGWRQHFIWPAHGRVSDLFGSQRIYGTTPTAPHGGVDVAVRVGTPIIAPADGIVILAADHPFTLEGNLLMVDHGMAVNSAFLHLSRILVHVGEMVRQGQLIGYSGQTGRATGPHLHWAVKWSSERVDPMSMTGPMH